MTIEESVRAAERELLGGATRRDPRRLGALLAPDFTEIGRSGRLWTRDAVLAALSREEPRAIPVTDQWEFTWLTPELVLVTYVILGSGTPDSRHCSVWEVRGGHPVIRFHQGTPCT